MTELIIIPYLSVQEKTTPLFIACEKNNIRIVKMLLAAGAKVDLANAVSMVE